MRTLFFSRVLDDGEPLVISLDLDSCLARASGSSRGLSRFRMTPRRVRSLNSCSGGAGHQFFIALQAFDFVSSAPTRVDNLIDWSKKRAYGYWFDENMMWEFAPEDGIPIDKSHCPRCAVMRPNDYQNPKYNLWRREHGIHDTNNRSLGMRNAIKSNSVGAYLRQHLSPSELSGFQMMILSP